MESFCYNHPEQQAVGFCGTCRRPTCYRCSLNMDDRVFCSLDCFNNLNPPSGDFSPRRAPELSEPSPLDVSGLHEEVPAEPAPPPEPASLDDYSDVVLGVQQAAPPAAEVPRDPDPPPTVLEDEASVLLSAHQAIGGDTSDTTLLEMNPVHTASGGESTLILIPGTKRALISSSCFFHPDTSAIVLCVQCRNPICSLCAQETPAGLICTPSCGPPDPAGRRERRRVLSMNLVLTVGVFVVLAGAVALYWSSTRVEAELVGGPAAAAVRRAEPPAPPAAPEAPKKTAPAPEPDPKVEPRRETAPASRPEPRVPILTVAATSAARPPVVAPEKARPAAPAPTSFPRPTVAPSLPAPGPALESEPPPAVPAALAAPSAPPAPPAPTALELDLSSAAAHLREAEPVLREAARLMYPVLKPGTDKRVLAARLGQVERDLLDTCALYSRHLDGVPDRTILDRRLEEIRQVLQSLDAGIEHLESAGRVASPRSH